MSAIVRWFEHSLILSLGTGVRINLFPTCGHCWLFQIYWHNECGTLEASSFRILNSSAGMPSPPWALLAAVLPKAYLNSHSRMSGSEWVITPLWLSRSRCILYNYSLYYLHLFLISSASIRFLSFLSFIVPIFGWDVLLTFPVFLKRSLVLPFLLFSSVSLHCSLKKAFLSLLAILWNSAFSWVYLSLFPLLFASLFPQLFVKSSQTTTLPSCISIFLGDVFVRCLLCSITDLCP